MIRAAGLCADCAGASFLRVLIEQGRSIEESELAGEEPGARFPNFKPAGPVYFREVDMLASVWRPLEREQIAVDVNGAIALKCPCQDDFAARLLQLSERH